MTKKQPKKRSKSPLSPSKSAVIAVSHLTARAAVVSETPEAEEGSADGQTTGKSPSFLLRLPPEMRTQLEKFKDSTKAKSLQALLLQFIGEGLAQEAEFKAADLFGKDLHVKILNAAVGGSSSADLLVGESSFKIKTASVQREGAVLATILPAHQRVIEELENQKLTGFAALMDPALMAYRILLQAVSRSPGAIQFPYKIDGEALVRDFSNGLRSSADNAVRIGRWGLAETLLIRACEIDRSNDELAVETAVYLLRRLLRRWCRTSDTQTPGVTNGHVLDLRWFQTQTNQQRQESDDETHFGTAERIHKLFARSVAPKMSLLKIHEGKSYSSREDEVLADLRFVPPRQQCWFYFSEIVYQLAGDWIQVRQDFIALEAERVEKIVIALRMWERSFRMTREVSALQREWKDWFEALEVLWWLGYRHEAYDIAHEVRGFTADTVTTERFNRIRTCATSGEISTVYDEFDLGPGYYLTADGWKLVSYEEPDEEINSPGGVQMVVDAPEWLLNRPDGD